MSQILIFFAIVLLLCISAGKVLNKLGVPVLLVFLVLGMIFGSDGIGVHFDNYSVAADFSTIALIFIMFYGGFGTNWKETRSVAPQAIVLSTLGTVITAGLTALFCRLALGMSWFSSLLVGSVVCSTDAASVFGILRSQKMKLKGGLAPLLEMESGSNDPTSYMLTMISVSLLTGSSGDPIWLMLLKQVALGLGVGLAIGSVSVWLVHRVRLEADGFYSLYVAAVAILAYALCDILGGNGFLCVYLAGVILGNCKLFYRRQLEHFFDGVSWMMQIMLFFMLGLLSFPSQLPAVLLMGTLLSLFMIFVARPIAVFSILTPFRMPFRQQVFVSWVGVRGAASIVFAIYAVMHSAVENDLFHLVLCVVLFSVLLQGTLIPPLAKKLKLALPEEEGGLTSFADLGEEVHAQLREFTIPSKHPLAGRSVAEAGLPDDVLIVMVIRGNNHIIPKGATILHENDRLVLSGDDFAALQL